MANILVVDDEHGIRDLLQEILNDEGHSVELAENAGQARLARDKTCPDLVLLDIWMPDTDGVSLLKEWSSHGLLTMPVIMMSGHATIETAVQATKLGAHSFLEKPITLQKLMQAVDAGLKKSTHALAPLKAMSSFSVGQANAAPSPSPISNPISLQASPAAERQMQVAALPRTAVQVDTSNDTLGHQHPASCLINLNQPLRDAKEFFDLAYFNYHLQVEQGSVAKVAEKTGLERTHLYRKLKQLGIDTSRNKH
jgi:DNA-binding NtrC family response regulator